MKMPQRRGAFHCCATGNDTTKRIEYTMKVTTRRVRLQRPCPPLLVAVDCESEEWKIHFRICDQLFRMIHCDHLHRYAYSCVCGRSFEGNASQELTPLCACVCACNSASQLKSFWSAVNRVAFVSFILWNRSPPSIAKSTLNTIWIIILWLFFHFSCSSFWLYFILCSNNNGKRDFLPETWRQRCCVSIVWLFNGFLFIFNMRYDVTCKTKTVFSMRAEQRQQRQ